jgi:hypothetical protein
MAFDHEAEDPRHGKLSSHLGEPVTRQSPQQDQGDEIDTPARDLKAHRNVFRRFPRICFDGMIKRADKKPMLTPAVRGRESPVLAS